MNLSVQHKQSTYWQRLKIAFQYVVPQFHLTRLAGWLAEREWGGVTHFMIKLFAKKYAVDMQEAEQTEFQDYTSFNAFFTRKLKADARKINENPTALCFPADGCLSQFGQIEEGLLLQAKGHYFNLHALLAGDDELTAGFDNAVFATTYLSPRDYHRVHMPCDGALRKMIYVPGELFSVNPFLAEHVPGLFARNERVICVFDTEYGTMVQILVGAMITASISTVWAGVINPPRPNEVKTWTYDGENEVTLKKGQEMGAFRLGSTVINLFQHGRVKLDERLESGCTTRVGEVLAYKQ